MDGFKITDIEELYSHFGEMAERLQLKNWKKGRIPDIKNTFLVIGAEFHRRHLDIVVAVVDTQTNEEFLISCKGLDKEFKKCEKNFI
jgi:hypothetical protein